MQKDKTFKNIRFIGFNDGDSNAIMTSDEFIGCQTSQGAVNCFLPPISVGNDLEQLEWNIVDTDINSATNNITINASGSNKINGLSSITISTNGAAVRIYAVGVNDYLATGAVGSGSASLPIVYAFTDNKQATAGDSTSVIDVDFHLIVPAGTYTIDTYINYFNSSASPSNFSVGLVYNEDTSITSYDAGSDVTILGVGQYARLGGIPATPFRSALCCTTEKVTFATEVIIKPIWLDNVTAGTLFAFRRCIRAFNVAP